MGTVIRPLAQVSPPEVLEVGGIFNIEPGSEQNLLLKPATDNSQLNVLLFCEPRSHMSLLNIRPDTTLSKVAQDAIDSAEANHPLGLKVTAILF